MSQRSQLLAVLTSALMAAAELGVSLLPGARAAADSVQDMEALFQQAVRHHRQGELAKAKELLERARDIFVRDERAGAVTPGHYDAVIKVSYKLGQTHADLKEYVDARKHLNLCIALLKYLQRNDDVLAEAHNALGVLFYTMGMNAEAEERWRTSLAVWRGLEPKQPVPQARCLNNLASVCVAKTDYQEARKLLEEARGLLSNRAEDPVLGYTLNQLGWVEHSLGNARAAESLYTASLAIWEKQQPARPLLQARVLSNRGWARHALGKLPEAEGDYVESLRLRANRDERGAALSRANLAMLHVAQGRWPSVLARTTEACIAERRAAFRELPLLPELVQISALLDRHQNDSHAAFFHSALSIAAEGHKHPGMADASANWVLNGKGLTAQVLAERELAARDGSSQDRSQLLVLRERLSTLAHSRAADAAEVQDKTLQLESLAARLGKGLIDKQREPNELWVDVADVRRALPAGSLLIEIARYRRWDFSGTNAVNWGGERYSAWIIPPSGAGAVQMVDLGPAAAIDSAAEQVLKVFKEAAELVDAGNRSQLVTEERVKPARLALERLAERVLWPIVPHVTAAERWVLAPDGGLWLVPWSALPLARGASPLVESKVVSFVTSGRDLVRAARKAPAGAPLVVADPKYTLAANGKVAQLPAFLQAPAKRLEGTQREARDVAPALANLTGQQIVPIQGPAALEAEVKKAVRPRVLMLCTHGFFLDGKEKQSPLLNCGLLFSGCNEGSDGAGNNGVLTGEEVLSLDLRGTELVVLSACETGLGRVHAGEGVASLRQAFQLAGARTVLATLWSVDDDAMPLLLREFFEQLVQGKTKAEALTAAQRKLIKDHETNYGVAHPFFWAALTVTGDAGRFQ